LYFLSEWQKVKSSLCSLVPVFSFFEFLEVIIAVKLFQEVESFCFLEQFISQCYPFCLDEFVVRSFCSCSICQTHSLRLLVQCSKSCSYWRLHVVRGCCFLCCLIIDAFSCFSYHSLKPVIVTVVSKIDNYLVIIQSLQFEVWSLAVGEKDFIIRS
jgi:hypothetical protein